MSSIAWGGCDHPFAVPSKIGKPIQALHKSLWWPVNQTKVPLGEDAPGARMHGSEQSAGWVSAASSARAASQRRGTADSSHSYSTA